LPPRARGRGLRGVRGARPGETAAAARPLPGQAARVRALGARRAARGAREPISSSYGRGPRRAPEAPAEPLSLSYGAEPGGLGAVGAPRPDRPRRPAADPRRGETQ